MKKTALLLALAALFAGTGHAGDWASAKKPVPLASPTYEGNCLSYDFIDLDYGIYDFGTPYMSDGDFWGVGFSKSIGQSLYLTGGYADGSYDFHDKCGPIGVDTRRFRMGLGTRHTIAKCVDLTFEGGADHIDAEYGNGKSCYDYDSWGYYVGPGIRARAGRFEMFAKALYTGREGDYSQKYLACRTSAALGVDEDGWLFSPGFLYHFTDYLAFKFAAEIGELDTAFTFGARYHF